MSSSRAPGAEAPCVPCRGLRPRACVAVAVWAAMAGWSALLFVVARSSYVNFREGRFDLGNMVQAVWSTTQGRPLEVTQAVDRRADRAPRRPCRSFPRAPVAAVGGLALAARPRACADRRPSRSAPCLSSGWGGGISAPRTSAGLLALGYLAYPWTATSAARLDPSRDVRDPAATSSASGFSIPTGSCRSQSARCSSMSTGELMGLPIAALGIWYALAREAPARRAR